jgi:hypothetical protein
MFSLYSLSLPHHDFHPINTLMSMNASTEENKILSEFSIPLWKPAN